MKTKEEKEGRGNEEENMNEIESRYEEKLFPLQLYSNNNMKQK